MDSEKSHLFNAETASGTPLKSTIKIREARINEHEGRIFPEGVREELLNKVNELCSQVGTRLNLSDEQVLEFEVMLVGPQSVERLKNKLKDRMLSERVYFDCPPRTKLKPDEEAEINTQIEKSQDEIQASAHVEVVLRDNKTNKILSEFGNLNIFIGRYSLKNFGEKTLAETVDFLVMTLNQRR